MAKDNYSVLVYKILLYLYACTQRKIVFDQQVYDKAIGKEHLNDGYIENVYRMMQDEGLIEGFVFTNPWGAAIVELSDEQDLRITAAGIRYLEENSTMQKVKKFLIGKVDLEAELIGIVGL
jgi:hypothetical protein